MTQHIKEMFVYEYHFLDDLTFIKPIENHLDSENSKKYIDALKELFSSYGWEGDGEIGVIWFPPFIGVGGENTYGHYVFHVKQSNNGTSFLASSVQLPFARLLEQNELISRESITQRDYSNPNEYEEINIVQSGMEILRDQLSLYRVNIENELEALSNITDESLAKDIEKKILGYNQCMVIQHLNEFIDDCYLNILIEVLNEGNKSNLKLSRSSVKIDLSRHYSEDDDLKGDSWLTVHMIINDIWNSYKFESFKEKLTKLIKPLEYEISPDLKRDILKHVTIRNCIQHHNWRLEPSSLKMVGMKSIEILQDHNSSLEISKGQTIILSKEEVIKFIDSLLDFADHFSSHVSHRVATRFYSKRTPKN